MRSYELRKRDAIEWIKANASIHEDWIHGMNRDIARERSGVLDEPCETCHQLPLLFPLPDVGSYEIDDLLAAVDACGEAIVEAQVRASCLDAIESIRVSISTGSDKLIVSSGKLCLLAEVTLETRAVAPVGA